MKKVKKEEPISEDDDGSNSEDDKKKSGVLMQNILKSNGFSSLTLLQNLPCCLSSSFNVSSLKLYIELQQNSRTYKRLTQFI